MENRWETMEQVADFIWGALKSLQMVTDTLLLLLMMMLTFTGHLLCTSI